MVSRFLSTRGRRRIPGSAAIPSMHREPGLGLSPPSLRAISRYALQTRACSTRSRYSTILADAPFVHAPQASGRVKQFSWVWKRRELASIPIPASTSARSPQQQGANARRRRRGGSRCPEADTVRLCLRAQTDPNVRVIDRIPALCDKEQCYGLEGDNRRYTDDNHVRFLAERRSSPSSI